MTHLQRANFVLAGSKILELGPGTDFGAQLILASHGADVTVADRFLSPWDSDYHPQFYRLLRLCWSGPADALDKVIAADAYVPEAIGQVAQPGEQLDSIADAAFDLVLTNAVLEHVQDLPRVAGNLARVTKSGGLNLHQIDFRDHDTPKRPLEFLLLNDSEQEIAFTRSHGVRGNRLRASQSISCFQAAGFAVERVETNEVVEENYFRDFLPRLRASRSAYRDWPVEDLRILGALLTLRKL